ncbi:Phage Tail Protein X [compost metagenome]
MKIYAMQGDTLDAICARYYGRTQGVVETVLEANPGLAASGVIVPHGRAIEIPEIDSAAKAETVHLWD